MEEQTEKIIKAAREAIKIMETEMRDTGKPFILISETEPQQEGVIRGI